MKWLMEAVFFILSGRSFQRTVEEGKKELRYSSSLNCGTWRSNGRRLGYGFVSLTRGGRLVVRYGGTSPLTILKNSVSLCLSRLILKGKNPNSVYSLLWLVPRTEPVIVFNASR